MNPKAIVVDAASPIYVDEPEKIYNKRVLVIEDGPTLTHGEMKYGAGIMAAQKFAASAIVDPRPLCRWDDRGYFPKLSRDRHFATGHGLRQEANEGPGRYDQHAECDVVVIATPIDLRKLVKSE